MAKNSPKNGCWGLLSQTPMQSLLHTPHMLSIIVTRETNPRNCYAAKMKKAIDLVPELWYARFTLRKVAVLYANSSNIMQHKATMMEETRIMDLSRGIAQLVERRSPKP